MSSNEYIISNDNAGERLDKVAKDLNDGLSRGLIQTLIKDEKILVNGEKQKANYRCKLEDKVMIDIPEIKPLDVVAENIPLNIVYEDNDVVVVDKESGMVVHPAVGHVTGTLVHALLYHCKNLSGINGVARPGIVHRIDRQTSGLLMVAKNDEAHNFLSEQLQNKEVNRIYIGIVSGVITHNEGTVDAPIGRSNNDRKKMSINPKGKDAITHFKVLERYEKHTLVEFRLETGRTHQIRVHMQYIGYPLLGDPLYGLKKDIDKNYGQYLHAKTLSFIHPTTNEKLEFNSELPSEFLDKLNTLK